MGQYYSTNQAAATEQTDATERATVVPPHELPAGSTIVVTPSKPLPAEGSTSFGMAPAERVKSRRASQAEAIRKSPAKPETPARATPAKKQATPAKKETTSAKSSPARKTAATPKAATPSSPRRKAASPAAQAPPPQPAEADARIEVVITRPGDLSTARLAELRDLCQQHSLRASGTRPELIGRLLAVFPKESITVDELATYKLAELKSMAKGLNLMVAPSASKTSVIDSIINFLSNDGAASTAEEEPKRKRPPPKTPQPPKRKREEIEDAPLTERKTKRQRVPATPH